VFAELCGWTYHTIWRLETGRTPFDWHHLLVLTNVGLIKRGDEWYRRFEEAIREDEQGFFLSKEELKLVILEAISQYEARKSA
jgi:hypothetical protein